MRISDWSSDVCSSDLITSPLSAVGDLLAADGLGGTLTSQVLSSLKDLPAEEDLDLLTVLPFGLKYMATAIEHLRLRPSIRSEERRVGKECVSTGSFRWARLQ